MIPVQDLCIGNWVYDGERTQFPMQVVAIGTDYVYLDFEGNEGDLWESTPNDVEGIPLTEELLERIGAEKRFANKMLISSYTSTTDIVVWVAFEDNGEIRATVRYHTPQLLNMATSYSVHYLHELQNLFWNITKQQLNIKL